MNIPNEYIMGGNMTTTKPIYIHMDIYLYTPYRTLWLDEYQLSSKYEWSI